MLATGPIVYRLGRDPLTVESGVRKRSALSQGRRRDGAEAGLRNFAAAKYA